MLDVEDFGAWVIYISFTAVIELVREGFIKNPLIRHFVSCDTKDRAVVAGSAFVLNTILFLVLSFVLIILASPLSRWMNAAELQLLFYVYVVHAFFYTFFLHFNALHEAQLNFKASFWSYFVLKLFFLVYVLAAFFFEGISLSLFNLAVAQVIATIFSIGVSVWHSKEYQFLRFGYQLKYLRAIFNHGKYSFGTNLSSMILNNIDSWMLGGILSPAAAAIYNPALRITRLVEVPMSSVASITYPKLVGSDTNSLKNAKVLYEKSVAAILATMIPVVIGVIIMAYPIVVFIAGEGYEEAAPILQIVMLYGIIAPFNRQFGNTLDAIGKAYWTFYFVLSSAALNVLLNYFMISAFGIIGAAIATVTTHLIGFFARQYFLNQVIGVNLIEIVNQTGYWYKFGFLKLAALRSRNL